MNDTTKLGFLKDEYLLLQKFYEDFDARIITIKGWSATVGIAAIGGGFFQSKFLWLFAAGASVVFWITEAVWKSFQYMYAPRIEAIEGAFRKKSIENLAPFQIYTSWFQTLQEQGFGVLANMKLAVVLFPHLITVIVGIALFLLEYYGRLPVVRTIPK
ncbi:MAG TPA: hypothetical protein VGK24_17695 [Candidatus Angelobacter sp.]